MVGGTLALFTRFHGRHRVVVDADYGGGGGVAVFRGKNKLRMMEVRTVGARRVAFGRGH